VLKDEELDQTVTSRSLTKFTVKGKVKKSVIMTHQLKFPLFYGLQNFVTVFMGADYWTLSQD